ncbi:MAG: hypothetical protein WCT14_12750, partial [Treponemataceae bacterium]
MRTIEKRGPSWYRPWTDRLTADFAERLKELRQTTNRMLKPYQMTIEAAPETAALSIETIADRLLAAQSLSIAVFRFEAIRAELEKDGKIDDLDTMDAIFKKRMDAFNAKSFKAAVAGYRANMRIATLCGFKGEELLSPFLRKAKFVPAAPLAAALADFHYLISGLDLDENARSIFVLISEVAGLDSYTKENANADFSALTS